jgi:hypothetical protein
MSVSTKYIELDSTYRNRNQYPNPGSFAIDLAIRGERDTIESALDPVAKAFPSYPVTITGDADGADSAMPEIAGINTSLNTVTLDGNASDIDNFYINQFVENLSIGTGGADPSLPTAYVKITEYNGTTKVAKIEDFTGNFATWSIGDYYRIVGEVVQFKGTVTGVPDGTTTLTINASDLAASQAQDSLVGQYIWIWYGPLPAGAPTGVEQYTNILVFITANNGTSITVNKGVTGMPAGVGAGTYFYSIFTFTQDIAAPYNYRGSLAIQQQICYQIELINLVLPNVTLFSGKGNRIVFYPYVYVQFGTNGYGSKNTQNILNSNNPHSNLALFRVPVDDTPDPLVSTFIKVDGTKMVQTVKFNPNENLVFAVYLPNGELFKTRPDTEGPRFPDPNIQISACFAIKPITQ